MGFLDKMVADLVADSTGLPVRGLVRRAGVKNLLLVGGAVAAGGVAAGALANRSRQPSGAPATPPPPPPHAQPAAANLPPVPTAQAPPNLPPVPVPPPGPAPPATADDPDPDTLYAMIRAMVGAALADGSMAPEERAAIQNHLGDSGLSAERQQQVHRDLVLPPTPTEIAAHCPEPGREPVYRSAVLVTLSDRDLSPLERQYLDRLAEALGLAPARQHAGIRDQLLARLTA
jgi:uncharacterized membrane protein YebE (DUF533 family)